MASKPGRPATAGTRRGNGSGWGAPKGKGAAPFTPDTQPAPEAKSAGKDVAKEIRDRIAAKRNEIVDIQIERALKADHPQGHAAAKDLLDRIAPVTQHIKLEDAAPAEMTDEELAKHIRRLSAGAKDTARDKG